MSQPPLSQEEDDNNNHPHPTRPVRTQAYWTRLAARVPNREAPGNWGYFYDYGRVQSSTRTNPPNPPSTNTAQRASTQPPMPPNAPTRGRSARGRVPLTIARGTGRGQATLNPVWETRLMEDADEEDGELEVDNAQSPSPSMPDETVAITNVLMTMQQDQLEDDAQTIRTLRADVRRLTDEVARLQHAYAQSQEELAQMRERDRVNQLDQQELALLRQLNGLRATGQPTGVKRARTNSRGSSSNYPPGAGSW
ncbi:hypothetical protein CALCODRAFT_486149 [Calocera cornea HHB12733]|uniref:Uncharacterized protein n=1 Tax=Calocera cornea HHB12733 TaxID=1353952 RepID=A0A165DWQ1_9BASI|nr:hypothetical protein CALCODRAFT_486149 [Calocera cornea HHB12733]